MNQIAYTFPIRKEIKAQFVVPDDLTEKEVARIKAFFDTLVVTKESK
jgi:hypothetical protein